MRRSIFVICCLIAGWYIAHIYDLLPMNIPYSVDMFMRGALSLLKIDELANPDDMEVLAALLYWLLSSALFGALVFLCKRFVCSRGDRPWAFLLGAAIIGGWFASSAVVAVYYHSFRVPPSPDPEQAVKNTLLSYWVAGAFIVCVALAALRKGFSHRCRAT